MTQDAAEILHELRAEIQRQGSPWCSREQAAAYCGGCSVQSIDDAANKGLIHRHWIGNHPRFKKKELDRWLEASPKRKRNESTQEEAAC